MIPASMRVPILEEVGAVGPDRSQDAPMPGHVLRLIEQRSNPTGTFVDQAGAPEVDSAHIMMVSGYAVGWDAEGRSLEERARKASRRITTIVTISYTRT